MYYLLFTIPLLAARRAMAAAFLCDHIPSPTAPPVLVGLPRDLRVSVWVAIAERGVRVTATWIARMGVTLEMLYPSRSNHG